MLDMNQMAVGESFLALGAVSVSDDGNLLAYSTDTTDSANIPFTSKI